MAAAAHAYELRSASARAALAMAKRLAQPLEADIRTTQPPKNWGPPSIPDHVKPLQRSMSAPGHPGGNLLLAASKAKQALEEARLELLESRQQGPEESCEVVEERENAKLDELLRTAAEAVFSEANHCSEGQVESIQSGEQLTRDFSLRSLETDQNSEDSQHVWDARWANMLQVLDDCIGDVAATMRDDSLEVMAIDKDFLPGSIARLDGEDDAPWPEDGATTADVSEAAEQRSCGPEMDLVDAVNASPMRHRDMRTDARTAASRDWWQGIQREQAGAEAGKRLFRVAMLL